MRAFAKESASPQPLAKRSADLTQLRAENAVLGLQRTVGNRAVQRLLSASPRGVLTQQGPRQQMVQREEAADETFEPCAVTDWDTGWHFYGTVAGGPYKDQSIALPYNKIAPLPDPEKDFDRQEHIRTFKDASRLEQLYHDATGPVGSPNRRAALWFVCTIEAVARKTGFDTARQLQHVECSPLLDNPMNCGVSWTALLGPYSDKTASGTRIRGIILQSFIDKSHELNLNVTLISNAALLLGGITAARAGLAGAGRVARPGGAAPPAKPEPAPHPTVTAEQPKPAVTAQQPKPTVTAEQPKPAGTAEPIEKPPSKTAPPSPPSPVEVEMNLKKAGLTPQEILGLKGGTRAGKLTQTRATLIDRLARHFLPKDLKALGEYLGDKKITLDPRAVDALIDGIGPGELAAWIQEAQIAEVHGQATRLPEEAREKSLKDEQDPHARARATDKPSPGREPRPFLRGNFAHRFAEFLLSEAELPRPSQAEVRIELRDGTGDIIRTDRIVSEADAGLLLEIKPAGRSADIGRAQLPGRRAALQREFPKKRGWDGRVVEYTPDHVRAWLREEARAAKAEGRPAPNVAKIMKLFGF